MDQDKAVMRERISKATAITLASLLLVGGLLVWHHLANGAGSSDPGHRESDRAGDESLSASGGAARQSKPGRSKESAGQKIERLKKATANTNLDDPVRRGLMLELAAFYTNTDPSQCWKWVQSLDPADPSYVLAVSVFASNVAVADHETWMNAIHESSSDLREYLILGGVIGFAENQPDLAWQEFQRLKDLVGDDRKEELGNQVISALAAISPAKIWPMIDISGEKGIEQCRLFFARAKFSDPAVAIEMATSIEDARVAQAACETYVESMGVGAMAGFLNGIASRRSDLDVGVITAKALDRNLYKDPVGAAGLIKLLSDDRQKDAFRERIIAYAEQHSPHLMPEILDQMEAE